MKSARDEYYGMTKWEWWIEGFRNFLYAWDSYETIEHFPDDFWEDLNIGWVQMRDEYIMSQPNFDPYNLSGRDPYYSYMMRKK